jgi:hypothetical protein
VPELNCTKCGEVKPIAEFHREARNTERYFKRSHCKSCDAEKNRLYISNEEKRNKRNSKRVEWNRSVKAFFPPELFKQRLQEQNGVCAICGAEDAGGRGAFHADHDHENSTPRGVLCHRCNIALGHFKDNPEILQSAIEYLNKYSEVE